MTQVAPFLTPRQAAELLTEAGLSTTEDTARRWAREGLVKAIRLPGGQYRIFRDALDAILSGLTATASTSDTVPPASQR